MTSENDINASCGYVQEEYLKHQCGGVISILNDHLDDFLARKERLTSHIQLMQEELEKIDGEISKAEYVLSVFKDEISIPESPRKSGALDASNGQFDEIFCSKADLQDIKDCGTQRQALYVITQKNDDILNLKAASALIVAAGMSKMDPRGVSGNLHTYLSNSEHFEWIGPSKFRLKPDEEKELTTGDELALAEHLNGAE